MTPVYIHFPALLVHILYPVSLPPPVHLRSSGGPPPSRAPILSPAACGGVKTGHCLHNPLPSACGKRGSWRSGVLPQRCAPSHPCPQGLAGLLVRRAHACRPGWEGGQTGWTLGSGLLGEEGGVSEPRPRAPPPRAPPTAGIKKRVTSVLRQRFLPAPRAGHLPPPQTRRDSPQAFTPKPRRVSRVRLAGLPLGPDEVSRNFPQAPGKRFPAPWSDQLFVPASFLQPQVTCHQGHWPPELSEGPQRFGFG